MEDFKQLIDEWEAEIAELMAKLAALSAQPVTGTSGQVRELEQRLLFAQQACKQLQALQKLA